MSGDDRVSASPDPSGYAMRRVRWASDLRALGLGPGGRVAAHAADVTWKLARLGLWLVAMPWSMMVTGVKGPGALRHGHRGPARRRLLRALVRRRTRHAISVSSLSEVAGVADGTPVRLRGTVRALQPLPGTDGAATVVLQQFVFELRCIGTFTERLHLVYEAAVDFQVRDDTEAVHVEAGSALLVAPRGPVSTTLPWQGSRLLALSLDPKLRRRLQPDRPLAPQLDVRRGWEQLVREGDTIELVGTKRTVFDATYANRLERELPRRPSVCFGDACPLVIYSQGPHQPQPPLRGDSRDETDVQ